MDTSARSDTVLVIGDAPSRRLLDALSEAGLTAVAERPSVRTFARVRQRSYKAVVIDDADPDRDALEIALNVRDYDETVPVIVLGDRRPAMRGDLLERLNVHWLHRKEPAESIARSVQAIIDGASMHRRRIAP